jgi:molybdenum cofactor biosynthesis enzyme MoaA
MKYVLQEGERKITGVCPIPFTHANLCDWGGGVEIFSCCPGIAFRQNYGIVDDKNAFINVWNSKIAIDFRRKLMKKDYSDCNLKFFNIGVMKPVFDFLNGKNITYNGVCDYPLIVRFSTTSECNLKCATCRDQQNFDTKERLELLNKKIEEVFLPLLKNAKLVYMAGEGEVFFSRHYSILIKRINETYPDMQYALHTNGILMNEFNCVKLGIIDKIDSVTVSIHSLKKKIYEDIMMGAKWEKLIENLDWLLTLKRDKKINTINFVCVVRKQNYKEMPEFVIFAEKYEASVRFTLYRQYSYTSLGKCDDEVINNNFSEIKAYIKMLKDPIFKSENCYLDPWSESLTNIKFVNLYLCMQKSFRLIKKLLCYRS